MKSLFILSLLSLTMVSCKKAWTCNCVLTTTSYQGTSTTNTTSTITDQTQSDAQKICKDAETQANNASAMVTPYVTGGATQNTVCTLAPN